ncbi:MAG: winged helix DNA-binding protein [Lachnospiraceae bacterium]|nr:winged helix DNA-binding protein [Lachnospiraceae bacterium]
MTEFDNAKIDGNMTEPDKENAAESCCHSDEMMREEGPKDCRRPEGRPGHCHRPEGHPGHGRCCRPEGPDFPRPEGPAPFFPGHGPMGRPFPPLPDPDSLMGLWIRSHRALERRPADHRGVRRVLRLLDLGGGSLSQRELTELMDVQPGSLSELLGKMEARGLISRIRSEEDHRRVTVSLTEAGRAKAAERGPRDLFAALNDEEKKQLKALLAKLTAAWEDSAR